MRTVALVLLLAACSREPADAPPADAPPTAGGGVPVEAPPDGAISGDALFQDLPTEAGFPDGLEVRVDGAAVEGAWLAEALGSAWAAWRAESEADEVDALRGFFAAPRERCGALLEEVLLDREARTRFPQLDVAALAQLEERLSAASGGRLSWHRQVHGEAAARAYLERQHRRALLEDWFTALSAEVPEEEVFAAYEREVLANLPPPEQREGLDVSYEKRGPEIRARMQRERGLVDLRKWLQGRLPGARLVVELPDGTRLTGE